jgi:hypothetical protein
MCVHQASVDCWQKKQNIIVLQTERNAPCDHNMQTGLWVGMQFEHVGDVSCLRYSWYMDIYAWIIR